MFNKEDERARSLVELVMSDSRRLKGNILMPPISSLSRQLNNDTLFLEFEDFDGGLHLLAKQAIADENGGAKVLHGSGGIMLLRAA